MEWARIRLRRAAFAGVTSPMRRIRWRFTSVVSWLACLVGLNAQDVAGSGGGAPVEPAGFRSYGDVRAVNVEEELAALRGANANLVGGVARHPVTFAAALAKAHALAKSAVEPGSFAAALKALPDNEPATLRLFAVAQLATRKPSAAFALLVAVHDKDPKSPDALADLAGMLASFGYVNEALALLDELAARHALPSPPMGISGQDALDYIRGYSFARLGDTEAAKPLLRAVADRQPILAEASRMMAILSDDPAEQRKYLLMGVWRHRSPLMVATAVDITQPEPNALTSGEEVGIDLRSLIDPAKGKRGKQPGLHYAQTVLQANDLGPKIDAATHASEEKHRAISESRVRPRGYVHTDVSVDETWGYRMQQLMGSIDYRDARLRELDRQRHNLWREREEARRKIEQRRDEEADKLLRPYMEACLAKKYNPTFEQMGAQVRPAFEAALAQLAPYINREEQVQREWFAEWHFLATAIAAQVGDAGWHEYMRLTIEMQRWLVYNSLLHLVSIHASVGQHPWITKEPGEVPTDPEEVAVEKCDGDKSVSFGTSTLPGGKALPFEFGVEMTCEGMSVEAAVDTRIPGISISAEIGGNNEGEFTAFVGPKAEAALGDKGIAAFTGSAKAGAYVTGNSKGVTDAGVKYEVKVGAKIGAFTGAQKVAEGNVSFFPAPEPGSGDFGSLTP
jgi:hypothetical protein